MERVAQDRDGWKRLTAIKWCKDPQRITPLSQVKIVKMFFENFFCSVTITAYDKLQRRTTMCDQTQFVVCMTNNPNFTELLAFAPNFPLTIFRFLNHKSKKSKNSER